MPYFGNNLKCLLLSIIFLSVSFLPVQASNLSKGQQAFFKSDYATAITYFNAVLKKKSDNAMVHFFIGESYFKLYDFLNAKKHFQRVIDIKPDYALARLNFARTCNALGDKESALHEFMNVQKKYPSELKQEDIKVIAELTKNVEISEVSELSPLKKNATDITPPKIVVIDPKINQGLHKVSKSSGDKKETQTSIKGIATDRSGILRVYVNNKVAKLMQTGTFSTNITVSPGENPVVIKATDNAGNTAIRQFTIVKSSEYKVHKKKGPDIVENEGEIQASRYFAILIAAAVYNDPLINDLDQPVLDIKALKNILSKEYTFNPKKILLLENPTRGRIVNTFYGLSKTIKKEDSLLIFYAGHGFWDEKLEIGYWLPSDAKRNSRANWLSNSTIRDFIRGIKSRHTLMIADACFSGGIFKTRSVFGNQTVAIEELYKLPSRKAITSGTLTEVPDKSVFVEFFLKRLTENNNKYVTSQGIFSSLRIAVINNSITKQIPQYGTIFGTGDEGGDFIFIRRNLR